jgi:HlyD family secretion protein
MDTPIPQHPWQRLRHYFFALLAMGALMALWAWAAPSGERRLRVAQSELSIASVTQGIFEDVIPLRGQIMPLRTIYLDAIEGGRVEKILVEEGVMLEEGQPIVEFSNARLQLESITREAQVSEQINLLQTQELNLARNALDHKRQLNELELRLKNTGQQLVRAKKLAEQKYIAQDKLDDLENQYEYLQRSLVLTKESQAADKALQESQLQQLRDSVASLNKNLAFARDNLESLKVKAPIAGRLTAFDLQLGQSLMPGESIGQIDDPDNFKVMALVDEFYKNRLQLGLAAFYQQGDKHYELRVKKIYPQVSNGQFRIDLVFSTGQPSNISRGQTLQMRLQVGASEPALLIPNSSFYQDTGGHWIFVASADGTRALRRNITPGRRNNQFIEVLHGLWQGSR